MANGTLDPARQGKRYAILFAGTGERWTLNDLEYCYRMLTGHYGFDTRDVFVLYFDGRLATNDNKPTNFWPDEASSDAYRIGIDGPGTPLDFKNACIAVTQNLQPQDLVFIHTNGHGSVDRGTAEAYLLAFGGATYTAGQFCTDLGILRPHASLLITMQQCFCAGFIKPVNAARDNGQIQADRVSMACASAGISYPNADKSFDCFSWGWVAAHLNKDPFGNALAKNVVTDNSGFIEAREAYNYARKVKDPDDEPRQRNRPADAKNIRLA